MTRQPHLRRPRACMHDETFHFQIQQLQRCCWAPPNLKCLGLTPPPQPPGASFTSTKTNLSILDRFWHVTGQFSNETTLEFSDVIIPPPVFIELLHSKQDLRLANLVHRLSHNGFVCKCLRESGRARTHDHVNYAMRIELRCIKLPVRRSNSRRRPVQLEVKLVDQRQSLRKREGGLCSPKSCSSFNLLEFDPVLSLSPSSCSDEATPENVFNSPNRFSRWYCVACQKLWLLLCLVTMCEKMFSEQRKREQCVLRHGKKLKSTTTTY